MLNGRYQDIEIREVEKGCGERVSRIEKSGDWPGCNPKPRRFHGLLFSREAATDVIAKLPTRAS